MEPTEQFIEVVAALFMAYGQEADKAGYLAYWMALGDVPVERVEQAVARVVRDGGEFRPTPAAVRRLATGALSPELQAEMAWAEVRRGMMHGGYYRSVDFVDKAINASIRLLGGWCRVCEIEDEETMTYERLRFIRIYKATVERGVIGEEQGRYLGGEFERVNGQPCESGVLRIGVANREPPRLEVAGGSSGDVRLLSVQLSESMRP